MWSYSNLAQPHRFAARHPYPSAFDMSRHASGHLNRADASPSKKNAMIEAGIYKGSAVLTAGVIGGISAYKGLPEVKGTAGLLSFDVIVGLVLGGVEMAMIAKGAGGRATAAVGGISTGLLCHWSAVQGTIWGAGKAKAESIPGGAAVKGVDYTAHDAHDRSRALPQAHRSPATSGAPASGAPAQRSPATGKAFDPYYGMM